MTFEAIKKIGAGLASLRGEGSARRTDGEGMEKRSLGYFDGVGVEGAWGQVVSVCCVTAI